MVETGDGERRSSGIGMVETDTEAHLKLIILKACPMAHLPALCGGVIVQEGKAGIVRRCRVNPALCGSASSSAEG